MATINKIADDGGEQILSRQDIADRYGVPLQTTSAWIQRGYGPRSFRVGKYTRYRLSDVLEWEAQQVEANA